MSKSFLKFGPILAVLAAILQFFTNCVAQDTEIRIGIEGETAKVAGSFSSGFRPQNLKNLSFVKSVTGAPDLAARIFNVELTGPDGGKVAYREFASGEFVAEAEFAGWSHSVDLTPAKNRAGAAHASWIGDGTGVLMLDDLVPQFGAEVSATLKLTLPDGWKAAGGGFFEIPNIRNAVIFIGEDFRETRITVGKSSVNLVISGAWHFTDAEAAEMIREVFGEYVKLFGSAPATSFQVAILKFPDAPTPGIWEAETRGRNVTIVSSDMPFRTRSLQRLHEQLRHELFHLWLPNGVGLSGDYAWFYEGFALYQSLKLAVALNRIRFEDFLDTLARAHAIDARQRPRISLIEASKRNVAADTQTYARGILVAFLVDIELLKGSKGKRDISPLFGQIFERYRNAEPKPAANEAVLAAIGQRRITDAFVLGSEPIDWEKDLAEIGIESAKNGSTTTLSVSRKLNGRQKDLLDRLGYNNWRKLAR
jgi:hypothetical protein